MLAHAGSAAAIPQGGRSATNAAQTACSLITPAEIGAITGTRIRDGEPEAVPEGTQCRFRSSDGNWVSVALGPIDAKRFAQFRGLLGDQAEMQAGVGDEAYFWGNVRIHVRVGTHSLTIGLARNDQGNAMTKAHVLALAKIGAPRLRP
jgi:hypothetical protein